MVEIWEKTHISDNYLVSTFGRVKSLERAEAITSKSVGKYVRMRNEKMLKPISNLTGYLSVTINTKNISIHRLVAMAFIDNPKNKPQVNHKDLIKTNNNVDNLEWVTASENSQHAYAAGVYPPPQELFSGELSIAAKLNNTQVMEIKRKLLYGATLKQLSAEYLVCPSTIGWINKGKSYSDVGIEINGEMIYAPNADFKKAIYCMSLSGDIIKRYKSARAASDCLGIRAAAIRKALFGSQITSGGYKWSYVNAEN